MTNTIRKRLGPLSVMATIAVIGALAAFIALAALPDITSAQTPDPPPLPGVTPEPPPGGGGPPPPPLPPPGPSETALDPPANPMVAANDNRQLTVSWDEVTDASGYQLTWTPADENGNTSHELGSGATSYTITDLAPDTAYAIEIVALGVAGTSDDSAPAMVTGTTRPVAYGVLLSHEADDGVITCANCPSTEFDEGDFEQVPPGDIDKATIRVADQTVRLHAEIETDSAAETTTVSIRIAKSNGTVMLDIDPGITYNTAGLNAPGVRSIEDGTLDIQIRDDATRVFDVHVTCLGTRDELTGTLDIEVRDEDQTLVAQATIMCEPPIVPPTPDERVSACYTISGMPDQGDDPDTLGIVEGEDIELFATDKSVQLTVSAFEKTYKTTIRSAAKRRLKNRRTARTGIRLRSSSDSLTCPALCPWLTTTTASSTKTASSTTTVRWWAFPAAAS